MQRHVDAQRARLRVAARRVDTESTTPNAAGFVAIADAAACVRAPARPAATFEVFYLKPQGTERAPTAS